MLGPRKPLGTEELENALVSLLGEPAGVSRPMLLVVTAVRSRRGSLRHRLEQMGCRVATARPVAALDVARAITVSLLLTDESIPVEVSEDLAGTLRETNPALCVLSVVELQKSGEEFSREGMSGLRLRRCRPFANRKLAIRVHCLRVGRAIRRGRAGSAVARQGRPSPVELPLAPVPRASADLSGSRRAP